MEAKDFAEKKNKNVLQQLGFRRVRSTNDETGVARNR